jgi:hypothetical protein
MTVADPSAWIDTTSAEKKETGHGSRTRTQDP